MDGSSCCNWLPAIRSVHKDALQYTARLLSAHYVTILFRSGQKPLPQIALERGAAHHKLQELNCRKFMDSITNIYLKRSVSTFKLWMAQVTTQRLNQIQDPETGSRIVH